MLQPSLCSLFWLLCVVVHYGQCQWTEIISGTLSMPGHVYQIQCTENTVVSGVITWIGRRTDLDLFIYQQGDSLMRAADAFAIFESPSFDSREVFSFNVSLAGKYYLRVYAFSVVGGQDYTITIYQNNQSTPTVYTGYYRSESRLMAAVHANNIPMNRNIPIKFSLSGVSGISLIIVSSSMNNVNYNAIPDSVICLPSDFSNGAWSLIFYHNTLNLRTFTTYSYSLSYDSNQCNSPDLSCNTNQIWSNDLQQCVDISFPQNQTYNTEITYSADTSFLGIMKIVLITIGCATGFFILLAVIICFCKNRRSSERRNLVHPLEIEEQYSQQNICQPQKDTCSICLDQKCDSYLPCQHWFHYKCIREWYARNKLCPMCRKTFQGLKIIKRPEHEIRESIS